MTARSTHALLRLDDGLCGTAPVQVLLKRVSMEGEASFVYKRLELDVGHVPLFVGGLRAKVGAHERERDTHTERERGACLDVRTFAFAHHRV